MLHSTRRAAGRRPSRAPAASATADIDVKKEVGTTPIFNCYNMDIQLLCCKRSFLVIRLPIVSIFIIIYVLIYIVYMVKSILFYGYRITMHLSLEIKYQKRNLIKTEFVRQKQFAI